MPIMTGTRAAMVAAVLIAAPSFALASWDHPNGDQARTNFARLVTAPAVRPSRIVPVGELQVGAGPVIAPDGTVFIGNLYGQVLAFHADGTSAWGQQLQAGEWVTASPVLGAGGSVYVISETQKPVDGSSEFVYESALNKFNHAGVPVYRAPFPQHSTLVGDSRGDADAPPNTMKVNGEEFVVAVAFYYWEWHLIAFAAPDGAVAANTIIGAVWRCGAVTSSRTYLSNRCRRGCRFAFDSGGWPTAVLHRLFCVSAGRNRPAYTRHGCPAGPQWAIRVLGGDGRATGHCRICARSRAGLHRALSRA